MITESLFTNRRGSPNTITAKEMEQEDEDLVNKVDKQRGVGSKKNNGIF